MISRIEPTLDEKLQHEGSEDIKKFLKIAEEQANINSQIIEALSSPNINRETKQQMVEILTDGAKNSSFFRSVAQEKKKDVDFGIHETIPARGNVADKFHKFKNMVVGFHAQLNPTITFRNPMNPDWYEVGHKVGMIVNTATLNTKTTYNNISSFFKKIAENAQVLYKQAEHTTDELHSKFYLIGEKKNVRKLEKKFSKIFDMLGLTPSEMLHTAKLTSNLSNEELNERISSSLESKFSAVKNNTEKKYEFSVLNGLNSELQAELVKTLIWPKMNVALKETLAIANSIQNTKSDNKYMKMVINFAEENNFNPDLVIHSLKNNPELLADYPNSKKIFANQNQILENADKYSKVIENNFSYLKEIIQATESLKTIISTLGIQQEVKDNLLKLINQSIVLEKREGNISYEQITKNLVQAEQAKEKTLSSKNPM